jgi:type II secretory pathway pseudopilin PulG
MIKKQKNYQDAFTLVETVIYLAIFILVSAGIVDLIFAIQKTNRNVTVLNGLSLNAVSVLEKITKDTREATGLDLANSILNATSSTLQLNTVDISETPHLTKFYLTNGLVRMDLDGQYFGPLMTTNATATALIFNVSTTSTSTLVKMELHLSAGDSVYERSEQFYDSILLRLPN